MLLDVGQAKIWTLIFWLQNNIQYLVITYNGKESEKEYIYIYIYNICIIYIYIYI